MVDKSILKEFGLENAEQLRLQINLRKVLMRKLPHSWQRKFRYIFGEKFYSRVYEFLRS